MSRPARVAMSYSAHFPTFNDDTATLLPARGRVGRLDWQCPLPPMNLQAFLDLEEQAQGQHNFEIDSAWFRDGVRVWRRKHSAVGAA